MIVYLILLSISAQCVTICISELILFVSLIFVGNITGDTLELDAAGELIYLLTIAFVMIFFLFTHTYIYV